MHRVFFTQIPGTVMDYDFYLESDWLYKDGSAATSPVFGFKQIRRLHTVTQIMNLIRKKVRAVISRSN